MLISKTTFLYNFFIFLIKNKYITLKDIKNLKRVGNGLSNTLILKDKYVIKIRNQIREKVNIEIYNGKFNNKFFYNVEDKFKREFEILNILYKQDLAPKPIEWNKNYLIIEYISSITLGKYIQKSGDYTIFKNLFENIKKLHSLNIFHGDLNLDNILITQNQEIKFIDFESSFDENLSFEEKERLEFQIMEEKMKRFYPDIYKEYKKCILLK